MTEHRLPWQLVLGGLLALGGAGILLFVLFDRADDPPRVAGQASPRGFGEVAVRITDSDGKARKGCLLAARTRRQRERGLMGVRDRTLGGHDGMAFLHDRDVQGGFWMRDTPLPLSIAFVSRSGKVVSTTDMEPCNDSPSCPRYQPAGPYRFAIEVPQGDLTDLGIRPGSRVAVGGRCAGSTPG